MSAVDEQVLEAASRWVAILKQGQPTRSDRLALKAWLDQSAEHAAALSLAMDVWDHVEPLKGRAIAQTATRSAFGRARVAKRPGHGRALGGWIWTPIGGMALAGLAAAAQFVPIETKTYTTAVGQLTPISLSDDSRVWLNTASRLTIDYTVLRRNLRLERGEAEFKVAHNAWRPFIVATPNATVRATGTDFSVRYDKGASRVVLVQGAVRVRLLGPIAGPTVDLRAGEALVAQASGGATVSSVDTQTDLAWKQGELVFYERPLVEVAGEFARYGGPTIRFADAAAGRVPISGAFRASDFKAFFKDISHLGGVSLHVDPQGVVIIQSRSAGA